MKHGWMVVAGCVLLAACGPPESGGSGAAAGDVATDTVAPDGGALLDAGHDVAAPGEDVAPGPDVAGTDAAAPTPDAQPDAVPYCMVAEAAPGVLTSGGCADNAWRCPDGQGCHDGGCGPCEAAAECRAFEGCRADGTCGSCAADPDCREGEACKGGFCVQATLPVWELTVAAEHWDTFWAVPDEKNEVPCTLVVDGTPYAGCSVRLRGGTSLQFAKRSFRIELDSALPTPGFSHRINLRAEYNDRSYMRTVLAYHTFSRLSRLPAPRTRYLEMVLNGEPQGLMVEVERIGDPMLERWGWATDTATYEADPGGSLTEQGACAMVPLPDQELYAKAYDQKGKADPGNVALRALIADVVWKDHEDRMASGEADAARIRGAVDTDLFVDYLALMGLLQSHDHVRKNYYLTWQQAPAGGRWQILPWDLDLSLGCLWSEAHETICKELVTDGALNRGVAPEGIAIGFPVEAYYNLLIDLVLRDPEHLARFRGRLCALVDDPLWTSGLAQLSEALEAALEPAVAADVADRNGSVADFHAEVASLRTFFAARADTIRSQIDCSRCGE